LGVITPLLFHRLMANAGRGEQLEPRLVDGIRESLPGNAPAGEISAFISVFLEPALFSQIAHRGSIGVPLFAADEVLGLVAGLVEEPFGEPAGRWWEFWRTTSGMYALFPADDGDDWRVILTVLIATGTSVQLRRLNAGAVIAPDGGLKDYESASLEPETCVHETSVNQAGAPYDGRCADYGCDRGCEPVLWQRPSEGIIRLLGCKCPPQ
jgi:hypothetical protein